MADVKVQKRESEQEQQRGGAVERRGGGALSPVDIWSHDLFTMNPFAMMRRLSEEMDRAFGTSFGLWRGTGGEAGAWTPAVEVREKDGNLVVCADLPGTNKEDVRVECTGDGLIIEGERKQEYDETHGGIRRSERSYGHFYRRIPLPEGTDIDKASAQFKDGVLEVKVPLPEAQRRKAREIPIKT